MSHYQAGILVAELVGDFRAEALFWLGLVDRYTTTAGSADSPHSAPPAPGGSSAVTSTADTATAVC